ncbi:MULTISPECIES: XdhC family protein [unclassified Cupriavidus]|uniref:XdhC family protein n=1 Tax=unclassified Cupriavidus TaxID=2640874 RepID=UPI003F935B3E
MRERQKLVLVTVVCTWGSSPQPPGAMAIREDGMVAGSVSGGCIEDDLIDQVHHFGVETLTDAGSRPA